LGFWSALHQRMASAFAGSLAAVSAGADIVRAGRKGRGKLAGQRCEAAGFLGFCQRRVVEQLLLTGDSGLSLRILSYLDTHPPLMAVSRGRCEASNAARGTCTIVGAGVHEELVPLPLTALVSDCSGAAVLFGAFEGEPKVMAWDLSSTLPTDEAAAAPRAFGGLRTPALSLWLDVAADRAAAGLLDGAIQLWQFEDGQALVTCNAYFWETPHALMTWGHVAAVTAMVRAPSGVPGAAPGDAPAPSASGSRGWPMPELCLASADASGVVCVWRENGHCVLCASPLWELKYLGLPCGQVHCLAVMPELLLCGFSGAVVAFKAGAAQGEVAFVLSSGLGPSGDPAPVSGLTVLPMCQAEGDAEREDREHFRILAVTAHGSFLCWRLPQVIAGRSISHTAKPARVLAAGVAAVSSSVVDARSLTWTADAGGGEVTMRWLDLGAAAAAVAGGPADLGLSPPLVLEASLRWSPAAPGAASPVLAAAALGGRREQWRVGARHRGAA